MSSSKFNSLHHAYDYETCLPEIIGALQIQSYFRSAIATMATYKLPYKTFLENSGKPELNTIAHTVLIGVPIKMTMLIVQARILAIWLGILITSDLKTAERESIYSRRF